MQLSVGLAALCLLAGQHKGASFGSLQAAKSRNHPPSYGGLLDCAPSFHSTPQMVVGFRRGEMSHFARICEAHFIAPVIRHDGARGFICFAVRPVALKLQKNTILRPQERGLILHVSVAGELKWNGHRPASAKNALMALDRNDCSHPGR